MISAATASAPVPERASAPLGPALRRFAALPWARVAPAALVLVVFAVAAWAIRPYPAGIFHDDGVYLILAKALASGEGYRYLHIPGAPLATHYPPGYPLLLAVLWRVSPDFPQNVSLFLFANALLLAFVARGVYAHARTSLDAPLWLAVTCALVATLSLPLLTLTSAVMSEVLFVALLLPLLAWGERAVGAREPSTGWWQATPFLLGIAAGALALVRTHALAAVAAIVLVLLLRRRWLAALWCGVGALVAVLPWQLWIAMHDAAIPASLRGSYGSYLGWFTEGVSSGGPSFLGRTLLINAREMAALVADRVAPWTPGWPRLAGLAVAAGILTAGGLRTARRAPVTTAFVAAYLAITLVWPYSPWRFVWALWPFVVLLGVEGTRAALTARGHTAIRLAGVAAGTLLAAGLLRAELAAYGATAWTMPARSGAGQIAPLMRWVTRHTSPGDILLTDAEPLVYLFTGRQAMPPVPFTAREYAGTGDGVLGAHDDAMADLLARYRVRYVVTVVPSTAAVASRLAGGSARGMTVRKAADLPNGAAFAVEVR